jgi:hypothetical protein
LSALNALHFFTFYNRFTYGKMIKMLKALILRGLGIVPSILITLSTLRTLGVLLEPVW